MPEVKLVNVSTKPSSSLDLVYTSWRVIRSTPGVWLSPGYNVTLFDLACYVVAIHDVNHLDVAENTSVLIVEHGSPWLGARSRRYRSSRKVFRTTVAYPGGQPVPVSLRELWSVGISVDCHVFDVGSLVEAREYTLDRLMWSWAVAILMSGWASSGVAGPIAGFALGVTLRYAYRRRQTTIRGACAATLRSTAWGKEDRWESEPSRR